MSVAIPSNFSLMYSEEQIRSRVTALGKLVGTWAAKVEAESSQPVLAVGILRGAVFFYADLLRAIPANIEPTFCRSWGYSSFTNEQKPSGVQISVDDVEAKNRTILMVDDICDTGSTLAKLHGVFYERGAVEVRSAVLIHRMVEGGQFQPDWTGFGYDGDEWFVGYGMEDKNCYANLPEVYILEK